MQLFASGEEILSLLIIALSVVATVFQTKQKKKTSKAAGQKRVVVAEKQPIHDVKPAAASDVYDFGSSIVEKRTERAVYMKPVIEVADKDKAKTDSGVTAEDDKYWFDLRQAVIYSEILNRKY